MVKKRLTVVVFIILLTASVCFGACEDVGVIEITLDWGNFQQTVSIKSDSRINARTVPYLGYDIVKGLYYDSEFKDAYRGRRLQEDTLIFVKTETKYPLEKLYFTEEQNNNFEDAEIFVLLNKGFKFDTEFFNVLKNAKVPIKSFIDDNDGYEQKFGHDNFRRYIILKLSQGGKEKILEAVRTVERYPQVYHAGVPCVEDIALEPNDNFYERDYLWGLNGSNGINMPSAWNITQGSRNVRVGIIDTGIANHVDLNANLTTGWDSFNKNNITTDDTHSHGTHVAGTIGAVGNNDEGITGINWNVTLVPLQASNANNRFDTGDVVEAIKWATARWGTNDQIDVINYSVSGYGRTTDVLDAIKNFPGLFVWGAGNDNENIDDFLNSASFSLPNLISVGSLDINGTKRSTSNYGKNTVDIFAPGGNIYSTVLNNSYGYKSGTSMAAPHVTGVAALLLARYPFMTAAELKDTILSNVDKVDTLSDLCITEGRLNAYKALSNPKYVHNNHDYHYKYVWQNPRTYKSYCV